MDDATEVLVSAVSIFELANKHRIGKWPAVAALTVKWREYLYLQGFEHLSIDLDHAAQAGSIVWAHKDPFDRMLVAQAMAENLTLVSNESQFDVTGVRRLW